MGGISVAHLVILLLGTGTMAAVAGGIVQGLFSRKKQSVDIMKIANDSAREMLRESREENERLDRKLDEFEKKHKELMKEHEERIRAITEANERKIESVMSENKELQRENSQLQIRVAVLEAQRRVIPPPGWERENDV